MINKREFGIHNLKKVLHKHGKQWIVVSAALLMMLGGGAMATKVSHADNVNNTQANVKVVNQQQPTVTSQARNLHSQILHNANQKSVAQDQTANTPKVENYQPVQVSNAKTENYPAVQVNNGAGNLVSLQKLYTLYNALAASGIFNASDNNQPVNPNNNPVNPSDHNNQPVKPANNNQPANQNSKYLVQNDNNQSAFIFNDTSDFNNDVQPTLMFHDVNDPNTPSVNVVDSAKVDGYNLNRIHDANDSQYNGWVLSDQLNSDQSQKASSQTLTNFLNVLKQSANATKYLVQNDNNQAAFIFNDTSDFNNDIHPTLMFHDVSDQSEPSVSVIGSTTVDGFNLNRIHDANDSNYNGWVLSDQLNSDQSQKASHQTLVNFLNALKGSKPAKPVNNNHYILSTSDMLDNDNLLSLEDDEGYDTIGNVGDKVSIIGQQQLDGHTFYQIANPQNASDDGWIYSGDLGNNKSDQANSISLSDLQNDIYDKYADAHAADAMSDFKSSAVNDINSVREAHGLSDVTENSDLDNFADELAQQETYENINSDNRVNSDMQNAGVPSDDGWGEIEYSTSINRGNGTFGDGNPSIYNNISGSDIAANINDDSTSNYRSGQDNNGDNSRVLNPNAQVVGVGAAYSHTNHDIYVVEFFDNDSNIGNIPSDNDNNTASEYTTNNGADNNNITSNGDGAVITAGDNNNVTANGSVIINGNNNNVTANGTVIDNGENNNVTNNGRTVYNDYTGNDNAFQDALANGVAVDASNVSNQNITD